MQIDDRSPKQSYPNAGPIRVSPRSILPLIALVCVVCATGCARYQYRVVEPIQAAQVLEKNPVRVRLDPMEYRLADAEGQLWMAVINPTDRPIRVVGEGSYVVDPRQKTHPLMGGVIAPKSYIDLSLPPSPLIYQTEPRVRFGFGYGFSHGGYRRHSHFGHSMGWSYYSPGFYSPFHDPYYDPFYGPPAYVEVTTPNHWGWETGEARVHFVFEPLGGGETNRFQQEFLFRREKAD